MKRRVYQVLLKWKNKAKRKPLIVSGVRQCGKTYLIKQFGEAEFEDVAYFNFDGDIGLQSIFDYNFDTERIVDELGSVIRGKKIIAGETLVIFDEIQACSRAIQSLKYFCENVPELHIIAAGSLLGVALRDNGISFPVGKVERLEMFPMSFEEFLEADGGKKYLDGLNKLPRDREIPEVYSIPLEKYYKNYLIVGGMPEVVQMWVETHNYSEIEEVQDRILMDYSDDFGKYADPDTANKIKLIWNSITTQIARDNSKFVFSHVKQGARAKDLENALAWLVNSGLVIKLDMVAVPEIPLSGMADLTYFKVYMSDVGLLRRKANINYRTIIEGNEAFIYYKGALAENYVLVQLKCMGIPAYFWRTKADAEMDFITDYEGKLMPIEVKSADNTRAKSLRLFCNRYNPEIAFKVSLKNVGDNMDGNTHVWSLPLYAFYRFKEYVNQEFGW